MHYIEIFLTLYLTFNNFTVKDFRCNDVLLKILNFYFLSLFLSFSVYLSITSLLWTLKSLFYSKLYFYILFCIWDPVREAAKKFLHFSGPTTKRSGGGIKGPNIDLKKSFDQKNYGGLRALGDGPLMEELILRLPLSIHNLNPFRSIQYKLHGPDQLVPS